MASEAVRYEAFTADTQSTITKITGVNVVETGGTNPITVDIRDGSSGGTIMMSLRVAASSSQAITFDKPVQLAVGAAYVDVGGTGTPRVHLYGE